MNICDGSHSRMLPETNNACAMDQEHMWIGYNEPYWYETGACHPILYG